MDGGEIAQVLTGVATLVAALAAAVNSIRNSRAIRSVQAETAAQTTKIDDAAAVSQAQTTQLDAMHATVEQVKVETNGMKTELINEVRAASLAQGRKDADADANRTPAEKPSS